MENVDFYDVYNRKISKVILMILRNIYPFVYLSLQSWKRKLPKYDVIIVLDTDISIDTIKWVSRHCKLKTRLIFCYRNSLKNIRRDVKPNIIKSLNYELWSYCLDDCKGNPEIRYTNQMLDIHRFKDKQLLKSNIIFDVIFIGVAKGRNKKIRWLKEKIEAMGLKTFFYVTGFTELEGNKCIGNTRMPYDQYIKLVYQSRVILDIVGTENYGLTYRPLEALFSGKKLLTNYEEIQEYDFYNKNNIFIYQDSLDGLGDFLKQPFIKIDESIINNYTIEAWIKRFI